jgi:arginine repressor
MMAKKGTGSKTRAVLDYIKAHPGVRNTEIAAALTKAGIPITPGHVSTIKNLNKEAVAKVAVKEPGAVNKSQAIRDYVKAHRSAANSEIVAELAKQGIQVTPNLVATVKAKKQKRRQVVKAVVEKRGVGIPEIKAGLACLKVCGTVSAAKEALIAAEEIKKMFAAGE